jgi:hypothetical protein
MATAQVLKAMDAVDDRVGMVESEVLNVEKVAGVDGRSQLRHDLRRWLSPPDPSINHSITCAAHFKQSADWFFQRPIFTEWKSHGSLLWLHGKRTFP